jgi:2-polyprenyl-3-methyl-5-hydroxy-6-metoxy-1,4-benzoquinol methylase
MRAWRKGTMDNQSIINKRDAVISKYGPWTAHNIHLQEELYTVAPRIVGDEVKLRRIVQCVFDLTGGTVKGLRILDLACLEGLYAIEFARHDANCLGIEGREANIEKARFAKEVLSLGNLDLVQDDVRNLSAKKYGHFDVVLCLGILYHLDVPDVFSFIERLGEVCDRICIVDTRIILHPKTRYIHNHRAYYGTKTEEHIADDSKEVKLSRLWASLDNPDNFYLSRATLYNALSHVGFTTVYECNIPAEPKKPVDRITVVGIKGKMERLINAPLMAAQSLDDMPERSARENSVAIDILRKIGSPFPRKVKRLARKLMGRENKLS